MVTVCSGFLGDGRNMAIFGNFHDFPPYEALMAVCKRTGTFVARLPARTVEIQLQAGRLVDFSENGAPVRDVLALSDRFHLMLEQREGEFEFFSREATGPRPYAAHPLQQIVSNAMGACVRMQNTEEDLPSEQTRFLPTGLQDVWLEEDLQLFWERAEPYFATGASALQLSGCTGVTARRAQWFLHRLRLAGLVRPRRAAEATDFGLPIRVQKPMELPAALPEAGLQARIERPAPSLLGRVMDKLAGLFR